MRMYPAAGYEVKWSAEDEYVRSIMDEMKAATQSLILAKRRQRVKEFLDTFAVVDTLCDDAYAYAPYVSTFDDARKELSAATSAYHRGDIRRAITHVSNALAYIKHGLRIAGLYGRTREKPKKLKEEAVGALEEVMEADLEKVAERAKRLLPEDALEEDTTDEETGEADEEW